jgi:hypothetical protein
LQTYPSIIDPYLLNVFLEKIRPEDSENSLRFEHELYQPNEESSFLSLNLDQSLTIYNSVREKFCPI